MLIWLIADYYLKKTEPTCYFEQLPF